MRLTILAIFVVISISCKAQSPVIPLGDYNSELINGAYQKDVNNDLNSFEGTWVYDNGTVVFTISFRKVIQYFNGRYYRDELIGDYRYEVNGVEILDYLFDFNNPNINDAQHSIKGNSLIYKNWFPKCLECGIDEPRFELTFYDTERKYLSSKIVVRHFVENDVEKIKVWLYDRGTVVLPYEGAPEVIRVPYGEYTLVKQ